MENWADNVDKTQYLCIEGETTDLILDDDEAIRK